MPGSLLCELIQLSQDPDKEGASHFKDEETRHREGKQLVRVTQLVSGKAGV